MAETLPNGTVVPLADGSEPISSTGVQEMRTVGVTADAAIGDAKFTKNNPGPFDFDEMKTPGTYSLGSPFPDGWANVPSGITTASIFNVYGSPVQSWCAQEIYQFGPNPKRLWRISRTTGVWNPWIDLSKSSSVSAMSSNAAWVTDFVSKMGGPVDTGGKAAFALRLDHGYTNYKALLRDGLLSRGIVPGIATNSRLWDIEENSGATISEVNGWVAAGEIEVLNHSATHAGGLDEASLVDEIVNGRLELEAQLPAAAPVFGFAPPGVTAGWDGFNGGNKDGWSSPSAQIILESHAYSLGYVGGARRVLDGQLRQALSHITLDSYDLTQARAQIDAAIAEGRGIQMMMHPRELDKAGKISTAGFFSLMDYIVGKRDAGDIVFLSPGQLILADATRRTPAAHTHPVSDVTGLTARLAALEQDTGPRNLNSLIPGYVSGDLILQRVGKLVFLVVNELIVTPNSGASTWTAGGFLPAGFRFPAPSYRYFSSFARTQNHNDGNMRVDQYGGLAIYNVNGLSTNVTASWATSQAFPSTLPGTPI